MNLTTASFRRTSFLETGTGECAASLTLASTGGQPHDLYAVVASGLAPGPHARRPEREKLTGAREVLVTTLGRCTPTERRLEQLVVNRVCAARLLRKRLSAERT